MRQITVNEYGKRVFHDKVYRVAIDAGFTCPNRDGLVGTGGCIFCSGRGSGDFTDGRIGIREQLEIGKKRIASKCKSHKYIAYFQAFTNTYAPVPVLRARYLEAVTDPEVVALSIATRPDCLPEDVLDLLEEINQMKPVWVELGLQTIHERTAQLIKRGYSLAVYDNAVKELQARGFHVIVHMIIGLPGESIQDMVKTCEYIGNSLQSADRSRYDNDEYCGGIKLQLLHVLRGTRLEELYQKGTFETLSLEEYLSILKQCIDVLPDTIVIHRMTGDGSRKDLIAPLWSLDKKNVINRIHHKIGYN